MVEAVAKVIGVPLAKKRLPLAHGVQCEVDGVSADGKVLVEAYAHQGTMRGAQLKKIFRGRFQAGDPGKRSPWHAADRRFRR